MIGALVLDRISNGHRGATSMDAYTSDNTDNTNVEDWVKNPVSPFVPLSIQEKLRCINIQMECILLWSSNSDPYHYIQFTLFGDKWGFLFLLQFMETDWGLKIEVECLPILVHIQGMGSITYLEDGFSCMGISWVSRVTSSQCSGQ
jgi:hypothetical protein